MTLKKFRVPRLSQGSFSPERRLTRSLLRKAATGNVHAYVQATSSYSNFVSEYLYLAGLTDKSERHFEIKNVLADCWRYLPYTRRVSDFERFLQVRLERYQASSKPRFAAPHDSINKLSHEGRFLLASRILNNWSHKSVRLALRTKKKELSDSLMRLRCLLTGVEAEKLTWVEQAQIMRISELLEGGFSNKDCRKIEKEVSGQYHALQFKADWLSYRCELANLSSEMTLAEEELAELNASIIDLIKVQPMEKPRLYDSLVNQISFVRLPLL
ncbi:hypothetical protein [Pelagicoccus sp. SDUM812002]|uniref:hypothetical protein n=1 Tax=Pelagicoccus sp. SDUM812002 TaxID=3041266 RepID=UPI00280C633C|nr:hypothetical protein [Pelagicoccus sp. SDUM812002]MDQ8185225.1 hypothetical protein [Pelagicoccus sp. SDUM812002]